MDLPSNLLQPITLWTKHDVQKWIEYCIEEYSLHDINLNDFEMNGKALLLLNEEGFKQRSLRSGDILYKALQQHHALIKSLYYPTLPHQYWNSFGLFTPTSIRQYNNSFPATPMQFPSVPSHIPYLHPSLNYMYQSPAKTQPNSYDLSQKLMENRDNPRSISSSFIVTSPPFTKSLRDLSIQQLKSPIKHECLDRKSNNTKSFEQISRQDMKQSSPSLPQPNEEAKLFANSSEICSPIKVKSSEKSATNEKDTTNKIRYYHDRVDFHGDILMKPPAAKNCRILWEFLYILLEDSSYEPIIHWENREKMIFRIAQADKLAALWGLQKNRLSMTYEKLSRGMRYYYSNNIISKEQSKRLLYRFMRPPDEIRKTMKRNIDGTTLNYSSLNKTSSSACSTPTSTKQETPIETTNRFLQYFSVHSPLYTPPISNSTMSLFPASTSDSTSKSDRSNSSSPVSFDSNQDNAGQYKSLSSSSFVSAKRKQPISLPLNESIPRNYSLDQPLDLVVPKGEENHFHYKKRKFIYTQSTI